MLFDPEDIKSCEIDALWRIVDLLTECENVQELAEAVGETPEELKASARRRFIVGPHAGPWDADQFKIAEIEANHFIEFQLYVPTEGGRTVVKSSGSFDRADEAGDIMMITRRIIRQSEMGEYDAANNLDGRQIAWLFFTDRISAMEQEAMTLCEHRDGSPTLRAFIRQAGPEFGRVTEESEQGVFMQTVHAIKWGDPIE